MGEAEVKALRNRAREADYLQREAQGDDEWCYGQLKELIFRKELPPARRRRKAEEEWKFLKRQAGEELADFDSRFDHCVTRLTENNIPPNERDQLLKYLDSLDEACSKHLEHHDQPLTLAEAKSAAARFFDVEMAYVQPSGTMSRQRATWDNDRRQQQAGLGGQGGGDNRRITVCKTCGGSGHSDATCPNKLS